MTEFPLEEVLAMQKRFVELYRTTGLLSVNDNYVHVTDHALAELSDPSTWNIKVVRNPGFDTPYHVHTWIQGTEFVAVLNEKEMAEYGLEIPDA